MQTKLKKLPLSEQELIVELTPAEYQEMQDRTLIKIQQDFKLPGFRPGQVPLDLIVSKIEPKLLETSTQKEAIQFFLFKALQKVKSFPLLAPKVEIIETEPFTFKAIFPVLAEIDLGAYQEIELKVPPIEVTPAEVEELLIKLQKDQTTKKAVTNRAALKTDCVTIDFTGFQNGIQKKEISAKNFLLNLNEDYSIPGLTAAIPGMQLGESKMHTVKFPKDFQVKDLAGQTVDFKIKLKAIEEIILPPIDDKLVERITNKEITTLAALRTNIQQNIKKRKEKEERANLENMLVEKLLAQAKLEVSPLLIAAEKKSLAAELQAKLKANNLTYEQFLQKIKKTAAEIDEEQTKQATKFIKTHFILGKLMEVEKIPVPQQEALDLIEKIKKERPEHKAAIERKFQKDSEDFLALQNKLRIAKLFEVLIKRFKK